MCLVAPRPGLGFVPFIDNSKTKTSLEQCQYITTSAHNFMSLPAPQCALKGWHPGERAVQHMIRLPERVSFTAIVDRLPEQHRIFHTSRLHFLPIATLDEQGRPWASVLCSKDGKPTYISSPSDTSLIVGARVWNGDPIINNLRSFAQTKGNARVFASALGIEVSTRRRNKFAGSVSDVSFDGTDMDLHLRVNQVLGLCPKYINLRTITPHPDTFPRMMYQQLHLADSDRLPNDVISFIQSADTAYLATSYVAPPEDEHVYPSRVGVNHRGGRPGFVRVRPIDGRTIVLPNYAGNRMMNSLGNIYITPLAGLVFPSFSSGSILYVTGTAQTLFGCAAMQLMPSINVITTIRVTGFTFVENALPLREIDGESTRSPYSPPVSYLAEEKPPEVSYEGIVLSLTHVNVHNDTLATFTFNASQPIDIKPSQNVVLDLSEFVRVRSHELLKWEEAPTTKNDDCIRTWTVSAYPTHQSPFTQTLTIRAITGGLVTTILYKIVNQVIGDALGVDIDISSLNIKVGLRGIGGDLPVPEAVAACDGGRRLLWIAGGIGLTPFLSLTRHVAELVKHSYGVWDIVLVLSTREPEVMLGLISDALKGLGRPEENSIPSGLLFIIHIFIPGSLTGPPPLPRFVRLVVHKGRLDSKGELFAEVSAKDREAHVCGPLPFVTTVMTSLNAAGVESERVRRERFTY